MAKSGGDRRPAAHPLAGADLATVLWLLRHGGGVPLRRWPQVAGILGSVVGKLGLTLGERAWVACARRGRDLETPPLFILGHWRSGTTHLTNLLAEGGFGYIDPIAAGLPWDFLGLGRLLRPLLVRMLPEGRFIDAVEVAPDSPQEDELGLASMVRLSYFHAIYFPRRFQPWFDRGLFLDGARPEEIARWEQRFRYYLWKVARRRPDRPLLVKNPVYTGRVEQLYRLYPEARFLHIVRNPHEVFASTRAFLGKMFEALALQPWEQVAIEETVLATYPRMMDRLLADTARLPAGRYVEIRFEELEAEPLATLERVHDRLGLGGFAEAWPAYAAYLGRIQRYERARRSFPERDLALVERHWGRFLAHWGYGRP
jgi:hypothetical protein